MYDLHTTLVINQRGNFGHGINQFGHGIVTELFSGDLYSAAFDVMVALTISSLPQVPHAWMSGTNPLQTPRAWF